MKNDSANSDKELYWGSKKPKPFLIVSFVSPMPLAKIRVKKHKHKQQ